MGKQKQNKEIVNRMTVIALCNDGDRIVKSKIVKSDYKYKFPNLFTEKESKKIIKFWNFTEKINIFASLQTGLLVDSEKCCDSMNLTFSSIYTTDVNMDSIELTQYYCTNCETSHKITE